MLCRFCNKIFSVILLRVVFLFGSVAYALSASEDLCLTSNEIVVGLLKIEKESDPHDVVLFQNTYEVLNDWMIKVILIDYIEIVRLIKKSQKESFNLVIQDEVFCADQELKKIKVQVANFIKDHKINRIFISGNCQNLNSQSFSSSAFYRKLVTEALIRIVDDDPTIHLLGTCCILQDIMNARGIEAVIISNISGNLDKQKLHLKVASGSSHKNDNLFIQNIKIVPNSYLAGILGKFLPSNENGWFSIHFLNHYSGIVDNTLENREKLKLIGYKVVAFSDNGAIEVIEDNYGNIYFQGHPEAFIIKSYYHLLNYNNKTSLVSKLASVAIINDFLHRS